MRILVLGSQGMLGKYILDYFLSKKVYVMGISRKDFDASDLTKIPEIIKDYDYIINCIGVIKQKQVSDKDMILVNSIFPHALATHCEYLKIKLIHISTDCVYDGKRGNYSETDNPNESELYGLSKYLGEPQNCCVIRTSIIGEEKHGKSLLEWAKSNKDKEVYGYSDHFWNGVTCLELAKLIFLMLPGNLWKGVKHIHSPECVSKYQLLKMISNSYGLNLQIQEKQNGFINKCLTSTHKMCKTSLIKQLEELRDWNITH